MPESTKIIKRNAVLTLANLAKAKALPPQYLYDLGLRDLSGRGVGITYFDVAGTNIAVKERYKASLKDKNPGVPCKWPSGVAAVPYGQWKLDTARKLAYLLTVEGESDCWALWHHGFPALGLPGADTANKLHAEHVEALEKVFIWREPDDGGARFAAGLTARLRQLGYRGKILVVSIDGVKDPADLHVQDAEHFKDRLTAALAIAREVEPPPKPSAADEPWDKPATLGNDYPVTEFPLETMPGWQAEWIGAMAEATQTPPDLEVADLWQNPWQNPARKRTARKAAPRRFFSG